jgi:predicted enzyme related to lactoylglutathione lyase
MREVTQHEPGTLCWTELATTNADSAKALYGALFDWTLTVPAGTAPDLKPSVPRADRKERKDDGDPERVDVPEAHHVPAILSLR